MEEFVKAQYQAAMTNLNGLQRELHKAVKNGNWHRFSSLCEFYYCLHLVVKPFCIFQYRLGF